MPLIADIKSIYLLITGQGAESIEPLKAGFSNYSYLVNHHHVLRIKKAVDDAFYDPRLEAKVIAGVSALKMSETVLYFNESDGTKLSSYLPHTHKIVDQPSEVELILVAKALRKLHRRKLVSGTAFDLFGRLEFYRSHCSDLVDALYERKVVSSVRRFYGEAPFVLCHNDVVAGNLLFRRSKVFLIDFEYAADNNPLFDLASFLSENDVSDEKAMRLFLGAYFNKRCDDVTFRRVRRLVSLQDILWYYWAQMRYIETRESIYKRIAHTKWKAIMKNASRH